MKKISVYPVWTLGLVIIAMLIIGLSMLHVGAEPQIVKTRRFLIMFFVVGGAAVGGGFLDRYSIQDRLRQNVHFHW